MPVTQRPRLACRKNERAAQIAAERIVRLDCHKIHTVTLLMNAKVRNQWINDPLLHVSPRAPRPAPAPPRVPPSAPLTVLVHTGQY